MNLQGERHIIMTSFPVKTAKGIHGDKITEGSRKAQMEGFIVHPGNDGNRKKVRRTSRFPKEPPIIPIKGGIPFIGIQKDSIIFIVFGPEAGKSMIIPMKDGIARMDHIIISQFSLFIESDPVFFMPVFHH